jgi:hypothetical protein
MVGAGDKQALENGSRWRTLGAGLDVRSLGIALVSSFTAMRNRSPAYCININSFNTMSDSKTIANIKMRFSSHYCFTIMWMLLVIFCFAVPAKANSWDDFTNNLATDLAPLVALFGEQVTKQFLSESTSPLDNIIFAVAPLGILTAVVSVIRVLGSANLRAFVGRAQEGRGAAEAELCSSTSNDVCEL